MSPKPRQKISNTKIDDEVWQEIGEDFDRGFDDYVAKHQLNPQTFASRLVNQGLALEKRGGQSFWERHRFDFLAIAGVLALVFISLWVQGANVLAWLARFAAPEPLLVTTQDIPAYTLLASDHLTTTTSIPPPAGALVDLDQALGRLTLKPLAAETPLTQTDVLSIPVSLDAYWLFSIPLSPTSTVPAEPGQQITLVGNAPEFEGGGLSAAAWLIAVEEERILVALPEVDARRAADVLAQAGRFAITRPLDGAP